MVVYWEYAFAENFLLDGLLLWLAVQCARKKSRLWKIASASALGAAEAVVYPLLSLSVWAGYAVKALGGALIALIAAPKGKREGFITVGAFFALTFLYGGALTAAYSFFGVGYAEGNGYLVEQAPVSLVFGGALLFSVLVWRAGKALSRYRKIRRSVFACELEGSGGVRRWRGLADSGNLLRFRGKPVCVVSAAGAFALFGAAPRAVGRIALSTVNGSSEAPVFICGRLRVGHREFENVYFTVGRVRSKDYELILHTDLTEGCHENAEFTQGLAEKIGGKRKRRTLSLRKRGAPPAALGGGGGGDAAKTERGRGDG